MSFEDFLKESDDFILESSNRLWAHAVTTVGMLVSACETRWRLLQQAKGEVAKKDEIRQIRKRLFKSAKLIFTDEMLKTLEKQMEETG